MKFKSFRIGRLSVQLLWADKAVKAEPFVDPALRSIKWIEQKQADGSTQVKPVTWHPSQHGGRLTYGDYKTMTAIESNIRVNQLLDEGQVIEAIKEYRSWMNRDYNPVTGEGQFIGLKDAKDYIDALRRRRSAGNGQ